MKRIHHRYLFPALIVAMLLSIGGVLSFPAQAASPALTLSPATALPGQVVAVYGVRFPANSFGALFWGPQQTVTTGLETDSNGTIVGAFLVPDVAAGTYRVTVRIFRGGGSTTAVATANLIVTASTSPTATPTATATATATSTATATLTATLIPTLTATATPTVTPTGTATPSVTPVVTPTPAPTGTFTVAATGNDANPGSAAQPFRTIQQALDVAQPGNTVIVRPGSYTAAHFVRSGTAAAPIILRAEFPATTSAVGSRSVLLGNGTSNGLSVPSLSFLVIDGFEIATFDVGISISGSSANILVTHTILRSNNSVGVQCASCSDSRFEGNAFLDPGGAFPAAATQDYGLNFYSGSGNAVVGNYFFGKHNQSLSLKHKVGQTTIADNTFEGCMYTCLYLGQNDDNYGGTGDLTSWDVTVERNVFRDAVDAGSGAYYRTVDAIVVRNVADATIRNNIIENASGSSIYVAGCSESCTQFGRSPIRATLTGNLIVHGKGTWPAFRLSNRGYSGDTLTIDHNTVYSMFSAFEVTSGLVVTVTANNFVNIGAKAIWGTMPASAFSRNNWWVVGSSAIDARQGATDTQVDPLLVGPLTAFDPATVPGPRLAFVPDMSRAGRYLLSAGSPLVDVGARAFVPGG